MSKEDIISFAQDDLEFFYRKSLFGKEYYFFGSKKENNYIRISKQNYEYVFFAFKHINKGITYNELKERFDKEFNSVQIDVDSLLEKFKLTGFIKGYERKTFDNEFDLLGFNFFEKKLTVKSNKPNPSIKKMFAFYILIPILLGFAIFSAVKYGLYDYKTNYFLYKNDLLGILLIWGLSFVAITLHELGHFIVAKLEGVSPESFNFGFLLGVIPMFYFKYKDIKIAPYKSKLRIIIAGVYTNFLLFLLFLGITFLPISNIFKDVAIIFSITNLVYCLSNLIPTRFGDGYFLVTTLLGEISPRINFYNSLKKGSIKNVNKFYFVYMIISYLIVFATSILFVIRAIKNLQNERYIFGYFSLVLFMLTFIFFIVNLFFEKNICKNKQIFLINCENKVQNIKRKNKLLAAASFFISISIMVSFNFFSNIRNNNINNYLNNNGISDLIVLNQNIEDRSLDEKVEKFSKTKAYIGAEKISFKSSDVVNTTNVIYCDINEVNKFFGLGLKEDNKKQIVVNDIFLSEFNIQQGSEIEIDNKSYVVSKSSEKLNYVFNNQAQIVIDYSSFDITNTILYGEILFIYLNHSYTDFANIVTFLDEKNYSYIDSYSNYEYVVNQTNTLKTFIIIIVVFLLFFGLLVIYYMVFTNLKVSKDYWSCLNDIGLSKKEILKNKILTFSNNVLFGTAFGLLFGTFITYMIVIIKGDTFYLNSIPNIMYLVLPLILILFVSIFSILSFKSMYKKSNSTNIKEQKKTKSSSLILTSVLLLLDIAFIILPLTVFQNNHLISLALFVLAALLSLITLIRVIFVHILSKTNYRNVNLLKYVSKLFSKNTKILSSIILTSFLFISSGFNLVSSSRTWARDKATNEYYYSYRITCKNDKLGQQEINNIISSNKTEILNTYYATSGKINTNSYYFFSSNGQSQIEKTYNLNHDLNMLKENEIVINTYGMGQNNYAIGDKITTRIFGEKKEFSIVGIINSLDYYGRCAFISPEYYKTETFSSIIIEGNLTSNEESFKQLFSSSISNYRNKEELINIWKRFYKIDESRNRENGGNGIGLSLVKAIMNNYGNEYGARNVVGGIEFYFDLDLK